MLSATALLPEFDEIRKNGTPRRRAAAIQQIGALFVAGAPRFHTQHVELFDELLTGLLPDTEPRVRAELAEQLSPLGNAPPMLVKQLVRDEEIRIAAPLLRRSPVVDDATLMDLVRVRGQAHLFAISERPMISERITDVMVRRGDRQVIRSVAGNAGALLSVGGYSSLIKRSSDDGMLAMAVGQRGDLSDLQLRELLAGSVDIVRRRLFQSADVGKKASIAKAMVEMSGASGSQKIQRDFTAAQRVVLGLHKSGDLNQQALGQFARERKYEESIAILAAISGLAVTTVDRLVTGEKRDSLLILGRALGLEWPTVRAMLSLRLGPGRVSAATDVEDMRLNFERLATTTAQRVLQFWKTRPPA